MARARITGKSSRAGIIKRIGNWWKRGSESTKMAHIEEMGANIAAVSGRKVPGTFALARVKGLEKDFVYVYSRKRGRRIPIPKDKYMEWKKAHGGYIKAGGK